MAQEDPGRSKNGESEPGLVSSVRPTAEASVTTGSVASEVIVSAGPENRPTIATEILRAEAGDVQATSVTMDHAGAEQVTAERVVMTNSGARTIEARSGSGRWLRHPRRAQRQGRLLQLDRDRNCH